MSVKPGSTLLMVMHGANSLDRDFAQEAMAPRKVLERPMLGMGSFTEVEMICTSFKSFLFHGRGGVLYEGGPREDGA